jgi:hypothetical protein
VVNRIKFRIHGGQQPGKFVYNVPAEATLFLNPVFRPVVSGEAPSYSLRSNNGQTEITLHLSADWNGKQSAPGTYDVRAGHTLTASGITVEILECPELAASQDRETTQFLDLSNLRVEAPAEFSGGIESAPVILSAITPIPSGLERVVEFQPAPEPQEKFEPELSQSEAPPVFRVPQARDTDSMQARKENLKKAAFIACGFVGGMIVANQLAQRYTFDIDAPEPIVNIVQVSRPQLKKVTPVMIVQPGPEVAQLEPLAPLPPLEAARAPASAPEDQQRGASLAALGKDLMSAVEEGNLKKVQKLVDEDGVSPDFTIDDLGRSPFVRAAAAGRVSVMQFLITKKVALTAIDFNGNNALMWSAINGHEKTAAYLLSAGIDPAAKREDGKTALTLAKQYHQKAIETLLTRAPASAQKSK